MKIGFTNNAYYPTQFGGAERSVQFLAESVVRLGHQATVLTNSYTGKYEESEVNGIKVVYLPFKNVFSPPESSSNILVRATWHLLDSYNPWMRPDVTRWLKQEKPDLVNTNVIGGLSVSAWDAIRAFGVPLVHTLREYWLQCRLMSLNRKGHECKTQCAFCRVCAVPRRARSFQPQAVVGNSRYTLDSHLHAGYFPGVPIHAVIGSAVPTQTALRKTEPASSSRLRLGFIGRIESLKGIDFLLKELESLPKDKYELFIGGTGDTPLTQEYRNKDIGMPVHWLGYVQPADFFQKIDLLVVPSLWQEPFGRVAVESYSYGIPVLVSRKGGLPESVEENVTGFVFDPEVPFDFRTKLQAMTPESCRAMGQACLEKSRNFEPDVIGQKFLDVYTRVLSLPNS